MHSYRGLFKMMFKGELQYRAKAISGLTTQFFWGIMFVYLYTAFMGGNIIEGFSIPQMASYVWLGQSLFVLRYIELPKNCAKEITNGDVCYKFVRPVDLYNQWYFEHLGYKLSATLLRFAPIIVIGFLLPENIGLMFPVGIVELLLCLVALAIGALLMSALSMIVVYLTFETRSPKGTANIAQTITGVLGGLFIPLPLMPQAVQNVLNFLPFRFIADLPVRIYIGSMDINTSLMFIGIALAWLIVLVLLGKLLLKKALKRTIIQGG
ncbi:MAG: ABC transporter permease [Clostridia bacterium]